MLRSGHGGADPVRGPKRLLPYAASSGRRVLAFFPLLLFFLFLLRPKPGVVPRLVLEQALHSLCPLPSLCFFPFGTISVYLETLIIEFQ